jgi:hypothetical protein
MFKGLRRWFGPNTAALSPEGNVATNGYAQEFSDAWDRTLKFGLKLPPLRLVVQKDCLDLGLKTAAILLRWIEFQYTPTHASWLNMAEIEIGVLQRQCLARCAAEPSALASGGRVGEAS